MQVKKNQHPKQNIRMMRSEPCEDNPSVNIVMQSGITIDEDMEEGKKSVSDTWVHRSSEKNVGFYLQREKEVYLFPLVTIVTIIYRILS